MKNRADVVLALVAISATFFVILMYGARPSDDPTRDQRTPDQKAAAERYVQSRSAHKEEAQGIPRSARDRFLDEADARLKAAGQVPIDRDVFDREIAKQQERIAKPPEVDTWEMARAQYQIQKALAKHIDDPVYAPTKH